MLAVLSGLLPRGQIWQIGQGRPVYDGYWAAIASIMSDASAAICREWCEADPCTANRTIQQWGRIWSYPVDCVPLDADRLCEWIRIITCEARPGTCHFIPRLLSFVGLNWLTVEVDAGCLASTESAPAIRITGLPRFFQYQAVIPVEGDCEPAEACPYIPEVECLRNRYFPAGIPVIYCPR